VQEPNLRLFGDVHSKLCRVLSSLSSMLSASGCYLISRSGLELAASVAEEPSDRSALCSLAAGTLAATESLGQMVGEHQFRRIFQRGPRRSLLLCPVGPMALLLVVLNGSQQDRISRRELDRVILLLQDLLERDNLRGGPPSPGERRK
jgi:predicted regulator of Ras-like GTPase activity (Roadblock/LC7/MglB family)